MDGVFGSDLSSIVSRVISNDTPVAKPKMEKADDLGTMAGAKAAMSKDMQRMRDESAKASEEYSKGADFLSEAQKTYKPPEKLELDKPPEQDPINPVKSFGSVASALAVFGSMLTRQPLTAALNNAAGAMDAIKANNQTAYDKSYKAWEANTKNAIAQANYEHQRYQDILQNTKLSYEERSALAKAHAVASNDAYAMAAIDAGRLDHLQEHVDKMATLAKQMEVARIGMGAVDRAMYDYEKQNPNATLQQRAAYGAQLHAAFSAIEHSETLSQMETKAAEDRAKELAAGGLSPPQAAVQAIREIKTGGEQKPNLTEHAIDRSAYSYMVTGKLPTLGMGKSGTANREAIINRAADIADKAGITPGEMATMPAEKKADAAVLVKDVAWVDGIERAQEQVANLFPIAKQYMDKLPLTEIRTINSGIIAGKIEFGSADANNYANAMSTIAMEWGRLMAGPQSIAMLPVEVVKQGMNRMASVTPDQFDGERELFKKEAEASIKATTDTAERRRKALQSFGGTNAGQSGTKPINSQKEYDALPSGLMYIDPDDGKTYRKP